MQNELKNLCIEIKNNNILLQKILDRQDRRQDDNYFLIKNLQERVELLEKRNENNQSK